jgi:hypothetical protein
MNPKLYYATIFFMQLTIVCLFVMILVALTTAHNRESQTSLVPVKGDKGQAAKVDYEKIDTMITEKIAAVPVAQPAPSESVDYNKVNHMIQTEVAKIPVITGPVGATGATGTSEQRFEQRSNPFTLDVEWRCAGDSGWYNLRFIPLLKDSCL